MGSKSKKCIPGIHPHNLHTDLFHLFTGCVPVPYSAYKKNQAAFIDNSLLVKPEVIRVLCEIWAASNKVASMRLFNIALISPLRLDEFENIQSQTQTQVL